jgi:hypothetical protein
LIAKKLFNQTVAIISGVMASFYAMLIYYDASFLLDSLSVFLDLALLGLLILTDALSVTVCGNGQGIL